MLGIVSLPASDPRLRQRWRARRTSPHLCTGGAILLPLSTLAARMKFSVRRVGQARTMTTAPLPATAAETTAHAPWPVRLLSHKMAEYISRMSPVWIEGQVIQLNANNASSLAFITLRDISVDMSLNVTIPKRT